MNSKVLHKYNVSNDFARSGQGASKKRDKPTPLMTQMEYFKHFLGILSFLMVRFSRARSGSSARARSSSDSAVCQKFGNPHARVRSIVSICFKTFPTVDLATPWSICSQWSRPPKNFKILTEGSRRTASACSSMVFHF